jgi:beta-1,3-galactosyltransferase 1
MLVPSTPSGRRPPLFIFVLALVFAAISFHSFYYGLYSPHSLVAAYKALPLAAPWLILTISKVDHLQRRQIIRQSWQRIFQNDTLFDPRFVITTPEELWRPIIEIENATYGDLIILPHEHENHKWANTVKTLETLTWVLDHLRPYTFVSKLDEDSFIDPRTFWKYWLQPRIESDTVKGTYIGRELQNRYPFHYASGQFYTMSWDYVDLVTKLWKTNHITDEHEDVLTARLMYEAKVQYNLTWLPARTVFDYDDHFSNHDGTAWAPEGQDIDHAQWHAVAQGAINVHQLKGDDEYLRVAACFDENGVKPVAKPNWDGLTEKPNWDMFMKTEPAWSEWKGPAPEGFVGYVGEGRGW